MVVSRFSAEFAPSDWKISSDFYLSITQVVITANVTWLHSIGFKNLSDRILIFTRLLSSQIRSVRNSQPVVFFSHNKSAAATNHQQVSSIFLPQQISISHQSQPAEQSD